MRQSGGASEAAQTSYDAAFDAYLHGVGTHTDVANEQTALARADADKEDAHANVFTFGFSDRRCGDLRSPAGVAALEWNRWPLSRKLQRGVRRTEASADFSGGVAPYARDPANAERLWSIALEHRVLSQSKIELLINPTDADHQLLYQTIETAISRLGAEESLGAETQSDVQTITRLGQAILRREWQRVKIGT